MTPFPIYKWKLLPIGITLWMAAATAVIADRAPETSWLLGALVTIGLGILATLWSIQKRMTKVETQVTPLWSALQREIAETLHHPHPGDEEMDALLEDLDALKMTPEKTARLKLLLRERADDETENPDERRRAELLLFVMALVVKEAMERKAAHQAAASWNS